MVVNNARRRHRRPSAAIIDRVPTPYDKARRTRLTLLAIVGLAIILRFAALGSKPLWLDEAITLLIALGRGPSDVAIGEVRPLAAVHAVFTMPAGATFADVVRRLQDPLVQHTHPPLYYLLAHAWFRLHAPSPRWLAAWSRGPSASLGVAVVLLIFLLGRRAASERPGLISAALAAVSPLMVMISQEARNYTLPLACVTLACLCLVSIVNRLAEDRSPPVSLWIGWIVANVLGCYAHYFVLVSVAAQAITLAVMMWKRVQRAALALIVSTAAIGAAFVPWARTFAAHAISPEQAWMHDANPGAYVYDTLRAWQAMVQGWPLDTPSPQLAWLVARIAIGLVILAMFVAGFSMVARDRGRPAIAAMALLVLTTVGALWIASALQQKNLAGEYRYHFVYYPALIVSFGAVLAMLRPWVTATVLALGVANSVMLVAGLEFPKPTRPREVAAVIRRNTSSPALIVIGEASFHETVVGLTFLRELSTQMGDRSDVQFLFVRRSDRYPTFVRGDADSATFWLRFAAVQAPLPPTVWVWSNASPPQDYPSQFTRSAPSPLSCTLDAREANRTLDDDDGPRGPFRRYRCVRAASEAANPNKPL